MPCWLVAPLDPFLYIIIYYPCSHILPLFTYALLVIYFGGLVCKLSGSQSHVIIINAHMHGGIGLIIYYECVGGWVGG